MDSIKFLSLTLSLIISITCAVVFENNPVVIVTQGVIEKANLLPISVFWYHPNFTDSDCLFISSFNLTKKWEAYHRIDSYTGFYELPQIALQHGGQPDNYCAVIFTKDGTLDNNPSCEAKVQWMYDRRDILGTFSLKDLVIPGTHHSAAYGNSDYESLKDQSLIARWTLTQTKSVKSQLMDGIRYLDLRPSRIGNRHQTLYMITHTIVDLVLMNEVVKQINEFMDISKDIVIVSLKEFFRGFKSIEDHRRFINYLEDSFRKHAHPREVWTYPLRKFWNDDKRLILSYDHPTYNLSNLMWPSIPQWWSNAQSINRLHAFFNEYHRELDYIPIPYAAMVELTHTFTTITADALSRDMSLRHWAERLGKLIPRWYTEEWNRTVNIIAADFYQTSGIVELAILLNEHRARYPHYSYRK